MGAFVPCCLYKKDEIIEGSNGDEAEPADISPTTSKYTEDVQSELEIAQESPILEVQVEENPADLDPCLDDSSRNVIAVTMSILVMNVLQMMWPLYWLELSTSGSLFSYETYALANCATTPLKFTSSIFTKNCTLVHKSSLAHTHFPKPASVPKLVLSLAPSSLSGLTSVLCP
ncbi:hypothetical protein SLEP1_g34913 [Rubroshorea leprosula]|uniref:Uncharacterized protein n=1 Tax=Rubroshorea leprosula TaxID=152421 RepID=A0AAV5KLJ2_9ROSI|nr:hypothetical protein SLEP1_g34913 [Rubroshorea leprosula]